MEPPVVPTSRRAPNSTSISPRNSSPSVPNKRPFGRQNSDQAPPANPLSSSPDVINNLIASFSSIAHPPEDDLVDADLVYGPQTPTRSPRRRRSPPPKPVLPDPSSDFREFKHPGREIIDSTPTEDAAEPPVIRKARPPSALSRYSTSKDRQTGRPSLSRPSSQQSERRPSQDNLAPLQAITPRQRSRDISPAQGRVSTDKTNGFSGRNSSLSQARNGDELGKIPDLRSRAHLEPPDVRSAASDDTLPDDIVDDEEDGDDEAEEFVIPKQYKPRTSSRRSKERKRIVDDDEGPPIVAGPSTVGPKRYSSEQVFQQPPSGARTPTQARPTVLETLDTEATSTAEQRSPIIDAGATSSPLEMFNFNFKTQDSARHVDTKPQRIRIDEDDDESDVLRRIRELKAAKEDRRRSFSLSEEPNGLTKTLDVPKISPSGEDSVSPLRMNPPESSLASAQLQQASRVTERKIISAQVSAQPSAAPSAVPSAQQSRQQSRNNSFADVRPSMFGVSSRDRQGLVSDTDLTKAKNRSMQQSIAGVVSSSRVSTESSRQKSFTLSRSGSRSRGKSISSSPVGLKGRSSRVESPAPDTQRPSIDSVQQSVTRFLDAPRLSQQIHFQEEQRTVTYSEVGDPNGFVVFCCVGMGLTRYITAFYDELATSLKLRLITPDRPGIGDSTPYVDGPKNPLLWPDDVRAICGRLRIRKFGIVAHSAGSIYALATALRMPQHIYGKIHILAPWIPPSQLSNIGMPASVPQGGSLPKSQRLLRLLPLPFFKLTNSLGSSSSMSSKNRPKSPRSKKNKDASPRPSTSPGNAPIQAPSGMTSVAQLEDMLAATNGDLQRPPAIFADSPSSSRPGTATANGAPPAVPPKSSARPSMDVVRDRQRRYDAVLTPAIWELATRNANPSVDLLVCLERNQPIGFRYADISKPVIIHHGSKDSRVPVDNVKWIGKVMRKAEVRILDGEGHGLMARAGVMGNVLTEVSKEWSEMALGGK